MMRLVSNQTIEEKTSHLDTFLTLSVTGDSAKVYEFLYSLELSDLIALLKDTDINHYTDYRLKHLIIADARERISAHCRFELGWVVRDHY